MRHLMLVIFASFLIHATGCNNNKIPCPTYADSTPEKKKKGKPGSQQPELPKSYKAKSGVLPSDGGGKRTKVPR
ncbi:MAG: hypothetical protein JST76_00875 [Bacteroidetes bacterium]|nr:hypothetical protein [Bacteroidota bacterium]